MMSCSLPVVPVIQSLPSLAAAQDFPIHFGIKARWVAYRYLFRARKYFSPCNLLTLYKAQIRPCLEYCSHVWRAAAPTTLSVLDAVQRRALRLIGDPALTRQLQSLSHRRVVGDFSLF
ncbi:unnamed protein product [Callosobruchus maculatus]|uniref:Tick transposon n=1 Tax=Callosobruchus maculatus TaxID=64391 RepID=A0A653DRM4_CALMS|nr:unnamed protein product [Callosobruchus maculatus]